MPKAFGQFLLSIFKLGFFCPFFFFWLLLLLSCRSSLNILSINSLSDILFWIFSPIPQFAFSFYWLFFFCCLTLAWGILVPQSGISPVPPAVEVQSLNHWTTREVPNVSFDAQKFKSLVYSHLSIFDFLAYVIPKKSLPSPISWSFLHMFSSRTFIVLSLMLGLWSILS